MLNDGLWPVPQSGVPYPGTGPAGTAQPEFVDWQAATPLIRSTFSRVERAGFRLLGIRQFMRLRVTGGPPGEMRRGYGQAGLTAPMAQLRAGEPAAHGMAVSSARAQSR